MRAILWRYCEKEQRCRCGEDNLSDTVVCISTKLDTRLTAAPGGVNKTFRLVVYLRIMCIFIDFPQMKEERDAFLDERP